MGRKRNQELRLVKIWKGYCLSRSNERLSPSEFLNDRLGCWRLWMYWEGISTLKLSSSKRNIIPCLEVCFELIYIFIFLSVGRNMVAREWQAILVEWKTRGKDLIQSGQKITWHLKWVTKHLELRGQRRAKRNMSRIWWLKDLEIDKKKKR